MALSVPQSMTVPPDVVELVKAQLEQGNYASSEDVLRAAMSALEQREKLQALRAKVAASLGDPRPALTPEEVRRHLQQHAQSSSARGDHA